VSATVCTSMNVCLLVLQNHNDTKLNIGYVFRPPEKPNPRLFRLGILPLLTIRYVI